MSGLIRCGRASEFGRCGKSKGKVEIWREFVDVGGLDGANPRARAIGEAFGEHFGGPKDKIDDSTSLLMVFEAKSATVHHFRWFLKQNRRQYITFDCF